MLIQNNRGENALHVAAHEGNPAVVDLLLNFRIQQRPGKPQQKDVSHVLRLLRARSHFGERPHETAVRSQHCGVARAINAWLTQHNQQPWDIQQLLQLHENHHHQQQQQQQQQANGGSSVITATSPIGSMANNNNNNNNDNSNGSNGSNGSNNNNSSSNIQDHMRGGAVHGSNIDADDNASAMDSGPRSRAQSFTQGQVQASMLAAAAADAAFRCRSHSQSVAGRKQRDGKRSRQDAQHHHYHHHHYHHHHFADGVRVNGSDANANSRQQTTSANATSTVAGGGSGGGGGGEMLQLREWRGSGGGSSLTQARSADARRIHVKEEEEEEEEESNAGGVVSGAWHGLHSTAGVWGERDLGPSELQFVGALDTATTQVPVAESAFPLGSLLPKPAPWHPQQQQQ